MRPGHRLTGKTILVTGAARGIGAEAASRLYSQGASIALVGLEPELLRERAAQLGERARWFEADVSDAAAMETAVRATVAHFGGIDVVIANAGIYQMAAIADATPNQLERTLNVNLFGVLNTLRFTLPHVIERKGYVLTVASLAAVIHGPLMGAYAASKAAVEAISDCLRVELHPRGVAVGCAYFGEIDTDMARGGLAHPAVAALEHLAPSFLRKPVSLSDAGLVIADAVSRRRPRVWAPWWVGAVLLLRGIAQPLVDGRFRGSAGLIEALELATTRPPVGNDILGVAANAKPATVKSTP